MPYRVAIGVSIVVLLVALWLSFVIYSTGPFQDCLDAQEKANKTAQETKENPPERFLPRVIINARNDTICVGKVLYEYRDATTAAATAFIALFTLTLWRSTKRLSAEAVKASEIAEKSANAATKSADAAVAVELPRFVVTQMDCDIENIALDTEIYWCRVVIKLTNHGRTGAEIVDTSGTWQIGGELAVEPRYPAFEEPVPFGRMIEQGEYFYVKFPISVTSQQAELVKSGHATLWVYGFIAYRDFLDNAWNKGFAGILDRRQSLWPAAGRVPFIQYGPPGYVYTRKEGSEKPDNS